MNFKALKFLEQFSDAPQFVNKLIISAFANANHLTSINNRLVKSYIIFENDIHEYTQYKIFSTFLEEHTISLESFEDLIQWFEFVISPSDKEVNGAVYTPQFIRQFIVKEAVCKFQVSNSDLSRVQVADIACGCGGFLIDVAYAIVSATKRTYLDVFRTNIYGLDIKGYSVERTALLLSLFAIVQGEDCESFDFNLFEGNALNFDWSTSDSVTRKFEGFDIVVGNPPYVSALNIDIESRKLLPNFEVCQNGKADLYIPFFQIGLENLKSGGVLGYISVSTFYRSLNGRGLRVYLNRNLFDVSIFDFGGEQVFKGRTTYTCICFIQKASTSLVRYTKLNSSDLGSFSQALFTEFNYAELNSLKGWMLNKRSVSNILKALEGAGTPLGKAFQIRNGFATLRNEVYIFSPLSEDEQYYQFLKGGRTYQVEKEICRDAIKPNILRSEAQIGRELEKIIFPYHIHPTSSSQVLPIPEEVLNNRYPYAYRYLVDNREILSKRDKGDSSYSTWFAYGRNQALTIHGCKLLFPYIADKPYFIFTSSLDLLFYNGYAIVSDSEFELLVLQKILKSSFFWFYIINSSKPYSTSYYSLAKAYIKDFGICFLTQAEKLGLLDCSTQEEIDEFLAVHYPDIDLKEIYEHLGSSSTALFAKVSS